jgi:hypothetical protein
VRGEPPRELRRSLAHPTRATTKGPVSLELEMVDEGRPSAPADDEAPVRPEMSGAASGIDLIDEFMEAGRSWSELDDDGMGVHRNIGP